MYDFFKKVVLAITPKGLLFKLEFRIRHIAYLLKYKGNKFECTLCHANLKSFIGLKDDLLCPKCGSLKRTRFLKLLIDQNIKDPSSKILHFTPHRFLNNILSVKPNYIATDYFGVNTPYKYDITSLPLEKQSIDVVICYHILEHVPDDNQAMKELYRVLKADGFGFLQVPFRDGETLEDLSIKTPEERLKHFGQEDHVRWYGFNDFINRLEAVGFKTNTLTPSEFKFDEDRLGLNSKERVVKVTK